VALNSIAREHPGGSTLKLKLAKERVKPAKRLLARASTGGSAATVRLPRGMDRQRRDLSLCGLGRPLRGGLLSGASALRSDRDVVLPDHLLDSRVVWREAQDPPEQ
jgi:hypothetical protein